MARLTFLSPSAGPYFGGEGDHGGAERQYSLLARALSNRHQVTVLVDAGHPNEGKSVEGVMIKCLPPAKTGPATIRARVARLKDHLKGVEEAIVTTAPDVVFQRGASANTWAVARAARHCGARSVFHWANDDNVDGRGIDGHWVLRWLYLLGRRRVDAQVCQHDGQFASIPRSKQRRSRVIPNGHSMPVQMASGGDSYLWVGRIHPRKKRPDRFLELAASMPERQFRMVGDVHDDAAFRQWFENRLDGLQNVRHDGPVASDQIGDAYATARCLVNTSDWEGFPNTFLEAFSHGIPVVSFSSDPGGLLARSGAGVCAEGSMTRMVEALRSMQDGTAWSKHREAAIQVAKSHTMESIADRHDQLIRQLTE